MYMSVLEDGAEKLYVYMKNMYISYCMMYRPFAYVVLYCFDLFQSGSVTLTATFDFCLSPVQLHVYTYK